MATNASRPLEKVAAIYAVSMAGIKNALTLSKNMLAITDSVMAVYTAPNVRKFRTSAARENTT